MNEVEIRDALRLLDQALRSAQESERWVQQSLDKDPYSNAQHAWHSARKVVRELEDLASKLKRHLAR